jgi:hypothetical protein
MKRKWNERVKTKKCFPVDWIEKLTSMLAKRSRETNKIYENKNDMISNKKKLICKQNIRFLNFYEAQRSRITNYLHTLPRPKHNKKKWRYYFLFILFRPTTKSIQFINKPVFLLWFFHVDVLLLLAMQQQQKTLIYIRSQNAMLGPCTLHSILKTLQTNRLKRVNLFNNNNTQ